MDPIFIYYLVNIMGSEFDWTSKDCPDMRTLNKTLSTKCKLHELDQYF